MLVCTAPVIVAARVKEKKCESCGCLFRYAPQEVINRSGVLFVTCPRAACRHENKVEA